MPHQCGFIKSCLGFACVYPRNNSERPCVHPVPRRAGIGLCFPSTPWITPIWGRRTKPRGFKGRCWCCVEMQDEPGQVFSLLFSQSPPPVSGLGMFLGWRSIPAMGTWESLPRVLGTFPPGRTCLGPPWHQEGFSAGGRRTSFGDNPLPCCQAGFVHGEGAAGKILNKQMPLWVPLYLFPRFSCRAPASSDGAVMLWWPRARAPAPVLCVNLCAHGGTPHTTPSHPKWAEKSNLITCH